MQRDIHQTWFFAHTLEEVWDCFTEPDLMAQWLMPSDFKPIVGHRFRFEQKPKVKMGWDGITYCEVLEIVPLKKLVISWKGGPKPGVISLDSVVSWELKSVKGGTQVVLSHTGFKGFVNYLSSMVMDKGWQNKVRTRLENLLLVKYHAK